LQIDHIEREPRFVLKQVDDVSPQPDESIRAQALGEVPAQQGRVVVAELRPEPTQTSDRPASLDREREYEEGLAVGDPSEDYRRERAAACADMPLPGREPIERLEYGAAGLALERSPLLSDINQVAAQLQVEA